MSYYALSCRYNTSSGSLLGGVPWVPRNPLRFGDGSLAPTYLDDMALGLDFSIQSLPDLESNTLITKIS